MNKHIRLKAAGVCSLFLFAGCMSLMEKTGNMLEGNAFKEKTLAVYRAKTYKKKNDINDMELLLVQDKAGGRFVIISLKNFPMIKFRGSLNEQTKTFNLTALNYLGSSVQGWNEYTLELAASGSMALEETAVLKINGNIEKAEISKGRIRHFETRITGAEAEANLRNRRERILATVEWMSSLPDAPKGTSLDNFEKHWKPILFPERVSKKRRPNGWLREGDAFVRMDSIRWNTGYTERVFPEELKPVRDSGTLLRDWEEALSWIYFEYEWDRIKERLSRETIIPIKK
jgi:hypothetical protein